jgi:hypothetical protein
VSLVIHNLRQTEQFLANVERRSWTFLQEKILVREATTRAPLHETHHGGNPPMTASMNDELSKIGAAEKLEIASLRSDGTLRKPVTVWVVRVGDDLYVRSVNGRTSGWFRGVQDHHEGRIEAGGIQRDVTFVDVESGSDLEDQIDGAYRAKYRHYAPSIVNIHLTSQARAATLKVVPRPRQDDKEERQ